MLPIDHQILTTMLCLGEQTPLRSLADVLWSNNIHTSAGHHSQSASQVISNKAYNQQGHSGEIIDTTSWADLFAVFHPTIKVKLTGNRTRHY
jgi:hypothetical protein